MNVSEALASRRSVRAFLDTPVPGEVIRRVIERAARAPSGGNLQPWHIDVLGGSVLEQFKALVLTRLMAAQKGEPTQYAIYPADLPQPYSDRRFEIGEAIYRELGIAREDKMRRRLQFANNFRFFGAPLALFCSVDRIMGPPQWSDLGMYLQSVMLLLREEGLDSCAQEAWAGMAGTVGEFLEMAPQRMLFCGMAIGYADPAAPVNRVQSTRAAIGEFAHFRGV